jgi:hypothetical protein
MTPERIDAVTTELKKFAQELSLSDTQKEQLRTHLADKYARLQEFLKQNANISRTELVQKIVSIRGSLREQVVKFLHLSSLQSGMPRWRGPRNSWARKYPHSIG